MGCAEKDCGQDGGACEGAAYKEKQVMTKEHFLYQLSMLHVHAQVEEWKDRDEMVPKKIVMAVCAKGK